jgi:splicing factor 3B subunit 3
VCSQTRLFEALSFSCRKYSEPLDEHANFLIPVPGGNDGPSGVLICSENYITYKNLGDQPDIRCPIPRRRNDLDDPERGMIFVCSATHKTKSMFFFLVQTEQGDIFKITLETDEDMVTEIKLKYFDTVPVASGMNVLKTGFLFVASEFGNHYLYQIAHLGKIILACMCSTDTLFETAKGSIRYPIVRYGTLGT